MKIKHIFAALAAVFTLGFAVSCDDSNDPTLLSDVQVSSSYVSIPQTGGTNTINVTAVGSWTISGMPSWLNVTPTSGSGNASISFSAESTLDGRTAELALACGDQVQRINVIQGLAVISPATCAEVIAGPDSKNYQVTGICTKIANTQYGNWYLDDGTGEIYIYGTVDASGAYNWAKFGIEVGDEVTVSGPKSTYNGTIELVDATFIKVNKSLIKVASVDPEDATIPTAGGEITFSLENKGTGLYVEVPAEASWLSIKSIAGNNVTFQATENFAGPRQTTLVFKTVQGKKEYTAEATVAQLGASGSHDLPFTVTEAIAYANTLSGDSPADFYVKGKISKIVANGEFGSYGNATFWISEDGEYHDDLTQDFEVYRCYWLDNQKWVEGNSQIEVGAEVIVCGRLTLYKGTAETSQNKAWIHNINGVETEANGIGTLAAPFNIAGAIAACQNAPSSNVFVKGKVSSIVNNGQFGAQYGNGTFWMSEDGTFNNDKSLDFEAYRVLYLGNKKWVEGQPTVEVGDDVVLCGQLTLYNGTAETSQGKAWIYSHNGVTE